jgi:hypothetical protein
LDGVKRRINMFQELVSYVKNSIIRLNTKPEKVVTLYDVMGDITGKIIPICEYKYCKIKMLISEQHKEYIEVKMRTVSKVIGFRIKTKYATESYYY